jgi:LuxR family maltose regulon positive regulatory protein
MIRVLAQCHLAELAIVQGQLRRARAQYEQAIETATDSQGRRQPIAGLGVIGLGLLEYEWNDIEAALRLLEEGIELISRWGEIGAIQGYAGLARVRQAVGDTDGADEAMEKAQQLAVRFDAMQSDDVYVAHRRAGLWIRQGRIARAEEWAAARELDEDVCPESLQDVLEHLTLAELHLAQKRPEQALAILEELQETAETAGWEGITTRVLVYRALALALMWPADPALPESRGEKPTPALSPLAQALALAEPKGYVRVFVDEGPNMEKLLRQAASWGIAPSYAAKLLAAFMPAGAGTALAAPSRQPAQPLVEPLSVRELEILRLLLTDLTLREIAQRLFIAYSTVRSHTKSIYGKLNVHSRREAVHRARELGLL